MFSVFDKKEHLMKVKDNGQPLIISEDLLNGFNEFYKTFKPNPLDRYEFIKLTQSEVEEMEEKRANEVNLKILREHVACIQKIDQVQRDVDVDVISPIQALELIEFEVDVLKERVVRLTIEAVVSAKDE